MRRLASERLRELLRLLLNHAQPEDRPFDSIVQDVKADQTGIEILINVKIYMGFRARDCHAKSLEPSLSPLAQVYGRPSPAPRRADLVSIS